MKKVFILFLLVAGAMAGKTQIKKIDSIRANKPVINSNIKGKIIAPSSTQTTTTPATNVPAATTQTSSGMIYTPPTATMQVTTLPAQPATTTSTPPPAELLPDIIITGINFSPNSANTYAVNYTLKNIGTAAVQKGLLSVQSYINGNPSGGGQSITLAAEINQLLNPGESVSSKNTFSTTGIVAGNANAFELFVNGMKANVGTPSEKWVAQQFSELSFTNNSIQSSFTIPPPPPPPADVLVTITGIEKSPGDTTSFVRIYYTLKNIGGTAIPQTASMSLQSMVEDTDNDPNTFLGTACCGQPTGGNALGSNEIPYAPGEVKTLYYDARVAGGYYSTLKKAALYKFSIEVSSNNSFTDGNNANNKTSYNYFLQ